MTSAEVVGRLRRLVSDAGPKSPPLVRKARAAGTGRAGKQVYSFTTQGKL